MHSYVYLGTSVSQEPYWKIGMSSCTHHRARVMNTSYAHHGFEFKLLIECESDEDALVIEESLHAYFLEDSTMHLPDHNGGCEWFTRPFTSEEIRGALREGSFQNRLIDDETEIQKINDESKRQSEAMKNKYLAKLQGLAMMRKKKAVKRIPRPYQVETLEKSRDYYKTNDKGLLEWPCGLGKTYESLLISQDYVKTSLMIGVYFVNLISQWLTSLKEFYPEMPILVVASSYPKDSSYASLNSSRGIQEWIKGQRQYIIIVSYQSAHLVRDISEDLMIDFKIYDECHHLCSTQTEQIGGRRNTNILEIPSNKTLGLSATLKQIDEEGDHIDNSSEEHFGTTLDQKSILWAIQGKHLCDYQIMTPRIRLSDLEDMISANGNNGVKCEDYYMYLSAYMALESLNRYSHVKKILIFCNRKENVRKVKAYIDIHLRGMDVEIPFIEGITDDNKVKESNDLILKFGDATSGILINITKVGEGIDIPSLDSVLFADDMGSEIRIIQSALRPCRIDPKNPEKVASLIIPMIFEAEDDESYKKEAGDLKIRGYDTLVRLLREISDTDDIPILKVKSSLVTRQGTQGGACGVFSMTEDIELDRTIRMNIYHRNVLGKNTFPHMKKIVQRYGGRDPALSLEDDFRRKKSGNYGLPDFDWVKDYLERRNHSWLDLYGIKREEFYPWSEFKEKTQTKTRDQYIRMTEGDPRLPPHMDLSHMYRKYGYTRDYFDTNEMTYDEDF